MDAITTVKILHISNDFCLTKVHSMLYQELGRISVEQTMLKKILLDIGGRDDLERRVGVGRGEGGGTAAVRLTLVPFELEGLELSVLFFQIAIQPQHVVASRQHLAKKCGLAHLAGSHNDDGLVRVKQRHNSLLNGSVYHIRRSFLRSKSNQKAGGIQNSYNNFGIKSKNLIVF